jgi:hypothetical protein
MGKVVEMGVALRPVSRLRTGPSIRLDLRVGIAPPPAPPGSYAWAVIESDEGSSEEIVVGGFAPNAPEAALIGARALETEQALRKG